jgi:SAM-dependent methyltransferase
MQQPQGDDWDRHWEDYADVAVENPAQQFRRRIVHELLGDVGSQASILDIGSGQGDLIGELAQRHADATLVGLEYSQTGVDIASAKVPQATFLQRDLATAPEPPPAELRGWASHAVCAEVLEHVDDPATLLRSALAYCAPDCRLVVTVPGGPRAAFDRHIGHRRHYDVASLRTLLTGVGLDVADVASVGFPFFNLYKLVVIARGRRLIEDVSTSKGASVSKSAALAMRFFRLLLSRQLPIRRWGWQIVAVAVWPGDDAAR